ncbi:MAG TPA: peptidoglycan DD-metalloendopeptidase family protein [Candidatus Baltobacteraceae bacterium]|jgi:murein DD-endopeptidase MepM/ murein hydrolase activator NlpD|nr:peptidoglycan DD-metalloendopeptidase family protein [Candidatus Baltobacteraceae bacterium]
MIKLKERYFIKIVPHRGDTVHRFEVQRRHIVVAIALLAVALAGSLGAGAIQLWRAHAQVEALRSLASKQQAQLQIIDRKTAAIRRQLLHVQRQNQEIQQLIGVHPAVQKMSDVRHSLDALEAATAQTSEESNLLRRLTMRVLNVRHLQELARAQALASIPSIDPVDGAEIIGCFCYRSYPDSEFHPGVDLGADYGDVVRAAAAGTVASAGWDGGYGEKIDIDHGNGYHTWYAHLSRMDVQPGTFVHKGQAIGLVGSTGFSTGPHLHYQVMLNGTAVDPQPYLNGVPPKVLASLP